MARFARPGLSARAGGGVVRTTNMAVDPINSSPLGYATSRIDMRPLAKVENVA